MKQFALLLGLAGLAGTAAGAEDRSPPGRARCSYADPSTVIAAELALARLAQEKGQWTAFAATAANDSVMFAPQMVLAQPWLKGRANPPVAAKRQPHQVWSSCDGSLMVSHGAWQGPRQTGHFTTLWQRQRNGSYKWIVDSDDSLVQPLAAPEMISAQIADCPARSGRPPGIGVNAGRGNPRSANHPVPFDPARRSGQSDDGTMRWTITVDPGGTRNLNIAWKKEGADRPVLIEQVSAPQGQ